MAYVNIDNRSPCVIFHLLQSFALNIIIIIIACKPLIKAIASLAYNFTIEHLYTPTTSYS